VVQRTGRNTLNVVPERPCFTTHLNLIVAQVSGCVDSTPIIRNGVDTPFCVRFVQFRDTRI